LNKKKSNEGGLCVVGDRITIRIRRWEGAFAGGGSTSRGRKQELIITWISSRQTLLEPWNGRFPSTC